ncbi:5,6-dimethylbenzimidazole synthase [Kribbella sp. NPDC059898]|uniref:5,6-dimethylbenzimidazole synthase n=1 Tax=Kribbella sp. NPDC059898 TaxID=3346995 RepID=UPI00365B94C7
MSLVVGVGLRSGTPYAELAAAVASAVQDVPGHIRLLVTLTGRESEPALRQLADHLHAQLRTFTAAELSAQPAPTPSAQVAHLKHTPSVAEAAVLATGAELLLPKHKTPNTTVAVGRRVPANGYEVQDREVVQRVIAQRRDVRRGFLDVPIDDDALMRVLEAAHRAPSVGLSQPWDFLLIRDIATRRKVHELASRQRDAFARSLPEQRRQKFDGLKIEAILDTPLNIAVTCDPGRGGRHVLGRHADPRTTWFSAAIAIQNLWLAARAEGIGVGWVSFFGPDEVAQVLGLPPHVELVGYLCVGYVDQFAPAPELIRSGWAERRPLSWAVHYDEWGHRDTSIVDDAEHAAQNAVRATGQRIHVIVGGDTTDLRQQESLVIDLGTTRPDHDFGVLWRPARTPAEAEEYGVEIARDLALQGAGHLHIQLAADDPKAKALAEGLRAGASASGLRQSGA